MQEYTLCFPINKDNQVLLGLKKRGHGADFYNGFGGKIEKGETHKECILRELQEESGIVGDPEYLLDVAEISFNFVGCTESIDDCLIHVFILCYWENTPIETEEMVPHFFDISSLPYNDMRDEDRIWIPYVLRGKRFYANFRYQDAPDNIAFCMIAFDDV